MSTISAAANSASQPFGGTPFDITADLDTPVSAFLKLRPFRTGVEFQWQGALAREDLLDERLVQRRGTQRSPDRARIAARVFQQQEADLHRSPGEVRWLTGLVRGRLPALGRILPCRSFAPAPVPARHF